MAADFLDDILTFPRTREVVDEGGNFAGGRTFIDELGGEERSMVLTADSNTRSSS